MSEGQAYAGRLMLVVAMIATLLVWAYTDGVTAEMSLDWIGNRCW